MKYEISKLNLISEVHISESIICKFTQTQEIS